MTNQKEVYPIDRRPSFVREWQVIFPKLVRELSKSRREEITEQDLLRAVFIRYSDLPECNILTDIYFIQPDYEELFRTFSVYDFSLNRTELAIELDITDDLLLKAELKVAGWIWVLHANDPDPKPSNPHAHQVDTGLKLDLATGELYKKTKVVDKIREKELKLIRRGFEAKGFTMPELAIKQ